MISLYFFMKKYLAKCLVAVSVMGMVSSCAHDEETSIYNEVQSNYIQAFNNTFGTPAEDQDWGFDQVMTNEARTTRAMGDYNGYKGSMQPVEWYQDTNDWTMKTRIYTFPSAPEFPTSRPSNAEYYSGGYKYFNGGSFYMDENTSKHVEIQGYCDMYVVKSGTGSGNVTIESTTKWYVGNVPYGSGQKIRIFVCPGVTLKIPTNDAGNLQANVEYYFAPGSSLVCETRLPLNGTAIYMAGNTTTTVPELEVNNNGIFYNVGTANIAGTISVENNNSIVVNDGVLNATNLYTKGSGRVQNNAELTLSNYTIINSNYNIWVNNGHYRTKYFAYTATSSSVINNCYLKVDEDFMMNIADKDPDGKPGDFKIDAGGGVLTKNFYGGGKFVAKDNYNNDVTFNGGPFKITMGSKAVFKVTETASLNALASGIATAHYGFEGVGSDYAVFQAKNVIKEGLGEGNVAYSGNLYVSAENHFAQGYSGQYPYIHYYNGCSEKNIYASGFESGKPAITIDPTPCNPGFEGKASENFDVRIIAEDLTATQGSDFDFNDVVFDVTFTSETTATITLQAAGGTLPLTVAGQNVHDLFNAAESEMINTNAPARNGGVTRDPVSFDITGINRANRGKDIRVMVKKNGNWIELIANKGVAAAKIAVKPTFEWCDEYQDIQNKYPKFADWVKNKEVIWYE